MSIGGRCSCFPTNGTRHVVDLLVSISLQRAGSDHTGACGGLAEIHVKIGQAVRERSRSTDNPADCDQGFIPNYGERYRQGERINAGFVESTVNQVVSRRFCKKQQMRWTPRGAHLLLQIRTRVSNGA